MRSATSASAIWGSTWRRIFRPTRHPGTMPGRSRRPPRPYVSGRSPCGTPPRAPCRSTTCGRRRRPRRRSVPRTPRGAVRGSIPAGRSCRRSARCRVYRPAAHFGSQRFEQGDALGRLRQEIDRPRKVDQAEVFLAFDDDGRCLHLSREPHDFRVASFAEDHDLTSDGVHLFVRLHHAGSANGRPPGRWRRSPRCRALSRARKSWAVPRGRG